MKKPEMAKKIGVYVLLVFVVTHSIFSSEWSYVPNVDMTYMGTCSEAEFQNIGTFTQDDGFHQIAKLPKEVTQKLQHELESYDLDVGDWFTFSCGYEYTTPKAIRIALRITAVNSNGTYRYVFYAWQTF